MKLKEFTKEYGDYEVDAEILMNILYKPSPKSVQDLEKGDSYYIITQSGAIIEYNWLNSKADRNFRNNGNCFLTKEAAKHKLERDKIEAELLELGGRRNFKLYGPNHILMYSHVANVITSVNQTQIDMGGIYFDTQEECVNARWTIGHKRLEKYWFNID